MTRADAVGARRAPERDAEIAEEKPAADGAWPLRAGRLLRARASAAHARARARAGAAYARARRTLLAAASAAIDKGIASLQQLRQRAGAAEQADERRDEHDPHGRTGRHGTTAVDPHGQTGTQARTQGKRPVDASERTGKPGARARPLGEPAAEEAVAPKPRRRLRGALVYLSVMLAGAMGGMALAYDLLGHMLEQRSAEVNRQEIKLSKSSKSMAELKKKLDEGQTKQTEAETRLAAALAENATKLGELQQQRDEAQARLASALGVHAGNAQRQEDGGGRQTGTRNARSGLSSTGDCNLGNGDIRSVLSGCIAEMNRR